MIDRKKLRELAGKASPGPWAHQHEEFEEHQCEVCDSEWTGDAEYITWNQGVPILTVHVDDRQLANAGYVAAASPETILALLDALEAAERERDGLREDAEYFRWICEHAVITDNSVDGMVSMTMAVDASGAMAEIVPKAIDAARKPA